jgi:hypothetical protein
VPGWGWAGGGKIVLLKNRVVLEWRRWVRAVTYEVQRRVAPHRYPPWNPHRVYWVDPIHVTHITDDKLPFDVRLTRLGGDWDLSAIPISETRVARALHQRFIDGRGWEETDLHPDSDTEVDRPRGKYIAMRREKFEAQAQALDDLWLSMDRDGYLTHRQLRRPFTKVMTICVGRGGRLIRNQNGHHRLVIAQLLGMDSVPARIVVVHEELPTTWRGLSVTVEDGVTSRS